jgi:hypothetical protein
MVKLGFLRLAKRFNQVAIPIFKFSNQHIFKLSNFAP